MRKLFTLLFFSSTLFLNAQLTITTNLHDSDIVNYLEGYGLTISNIQVTGTPNSIGFFSGNSNMSFGSGVVMGTGNVTNFGLASSHFLSDNMQISGDSDLSVMSGGQTFDASVIEFDCIPVNQYIQFDFAFGSEEYNEYVGSFNDLFAILVSGHDSTGNFFTKKNIALIPGTTIQVSISTINNGFSQSGIPSGGPCDNCQYFIDNTTGNSVAFDAFTTSMTGTIRVIPDSLYHFKIAIADQSDGLWDSGVMFLTCKPPEKSDCLEVG